MCKGSTTWRFTPHIGIFPHQPMPIQHGRSRVSLLLYLIPANLSFLQYMNHFDYNREAHAPRTLHKIDSKTCDQNISSGSLPMLPEFYLPIASDIINATFERHVEAEPSPQRGYQSRWVGLWAGSLPAPASVRTPSPPACVYRFLVL